MATGFGLEVGTRNMADKSGLQTGYSEFSFPLRSNEGKYHQAQGVSGVSETRWRMEYYSRGGERCEEDVELYPWNHQPRVM